MELLERLFSLQGEGRQGWGEKGWPSGALLASVSPSGELAGRETSLPVHTRSPKSLLRFRLDLYSWWPLSSR